jgi:hypothetical protein
MELGQRGFSRSSSLFKLFYKLITDVDRYRSFISESLDNLNYGVDVDSQHSELAASASFPRIYLLGTMEVQDSFLAFRYNQAYKLDNITAQ